MACSRRVVFGLGTGRCGTQSLAVILNQQSQAAVTHERLGPAVAWNGSRQTVAQLLQDCLAAPGLELAGDVAFYYLPYVEQILALAPHARLVCMRRARSETIKSYLRWTPGKNYWMLHDGSRWKLDPWDHCYPKYDVSDKIRAIGRYWDDYYRRASELEIAYPQAFRIVSIEALNSAEGQHALFDFIGIPPDERKILLGVRVNKSPPSRSARFILKVAQALGIRRSA